MSPNTIQHNAVITVVGSSEHTIAPQTSMPSIGTIGTNGVLNGLGRSGSALRIIITPRHTIINASNVPIEVRSPATLPGIKAPKKPTNTNKIRFDLYGVLN